MQAQSQWAPPSGTLGVIVAEARARARELRPRRPDLAAAASRRAIPPSLAAALHRPDVAVIAEVKRRSPSKGAINPRISALQQAGAYESGGAAAISVLTEPIHFGGSVADLEEVCGSVRVPVLRKDFHVDPVQLMEARAAGASAVLLIARALSPRELVTMEGAARDLGLETVVEIRDEQELDRALSAGAAIIGVNNRDLESLTLDAGTTRRLVPAVPPDRLAIAESGIVEAEQVRAAAAAGADAVLVGSSLSAAVEPAAAVRALTGIPRVKRGRD